VLVGLVLASMSLAGAAFAQSAEQPPEDEVRGEVIRNVPPEEEAPGVLPSLQQPSEDQEVAPEVLPVTGADLTLFVVAGAAAVGLGTLLVRRARSRA
jgi:LPXTG-motif cell wall-anchored protein